MVKIIAENPDYEPDDNNFTSKGDIPDNDNPDDGFFSIPSQLPLASLTLEEQCMRQKQFLWQRERTKKTKYWV